MIVETCPVCGADLIHITYTTYPPKHKVQCSKCGWNYMEDEKIERIPWVYDQDNLASIPENCRYCGNHPRNGGTGICNCILGSTGIKC